MLVMFSIVKLFSIIVGIRLSSLVIVFVQNVFSLLDELMKMLLIDDICLCIFFGVVNCRMVEWIIIDMLLKVLQNSRIIVDSQKLCDSLNLIMYSLNLVIVNSSMWLVLCCSGWWVSYSFMYIEFSVGVVCRMFRFFGLWCRILCRNVGSIVIMFLSSIENMFSVIVLIMIWLFSMKWLFLVMFLKIGVVGLLCIGLDMCSMVRQFIVIVVMFIVMLQVMFLLFQVISSLFSVGLVIMLVWNIIVFRFVLCVYCWCLSICVNSVLQIGDRNVCIIFVIVIVVQIGYILWNGSQFCVIVVSIIVVSISLLVVIMFSWWCGR